MDWSGNTCSAQTWGGWFVPDLRQRVKLDVRSDRQHHRLHPTTSGRVPGVKWTASRMGNNFVSRAIKASPNSTDRACPAATPSPSLHRAPIPQTCSSYVSSSIPLEDGNGNNVQVSFSLLGRRRNLHESVATQVCAIYRIHLKPSRRWVTPPPIICLTSGTLPADFTLNGGESSCGSNFPVVFGGNHRHCQRRLSIDTHRVGRRESRRSRPSRSTSPRNWRSSPPIRSTGWPAFRVSFLVVATGIPAPTLSMDPDFPLGGLTFKDNGNGTALISGTVGLPGGDIRCFKVMNGQSVPLHGIIATGSRGTVEQAFTMKIWLRPPQRSFPVAPPPLPLPRALRARPSLPAFPTRFC